MALGSLVDLVQLALEACSCGQSSSDLVPSTLAAIGTCASQGVFLARLLLQGVGDLALLAALVTS